MDKKKRKAKLICKTPWLERVPKDPDWLDPKGPMDGWYLDRHWWFCGVPLGAYFEIPRARCTRIQGLLYDGRPSEDALCVEFKLAHGSVYYHVNDIPADQSADADWGLIFSIAKRLLINTLFSGAADGIKTAYLEIELED